MGATYVQEFGPRFFDMSSTSGNMGAKYVQEFGPRLFDMSTASGSANYLQEFGPIFFDMSSASGYMGAKYFQEFGPRFLTCLQANSYPVHASFKLICSFRLMTSRIFRLVLAGNVYHIV